MEEQKMIDLDKIAMIESSGGKHTKSSISGDSVGAYQVRPMIVQEYNKFGGGKKLTRMELQNPDVNKFLSDWYLHTRIPQMYDAWKVPVTPEHVIMGYNWGPGSVRKWVANGSNQEQVPQITKDYLTKYFGEPHAASVS